MAKILKNFGIGMKKYTINANNPQAQTSSNDDLNGVTKLTFVPSKTNKTKCKKQTSNSEYSTDEFIHLMTNLRDDHETGKSTIDNVQAMKKETKMNVYEIRSATPRQVATSTIKDVQGSLQWEKQSYLPRCKIDHVNKDIVCEDYSNPADLRLENVYSEPCEAEFKKEVTSDEIYEDVDEDYDNPWEWSSFSELRSDRETSRKEKTMSGRQRHMYETAFDSMVTHDMNDMEEMINHPILRNECSNTGTPKITPKMPVRAITSHEVSNPSCLTPREKRKVTLIRDGRRGTTNEQMGLPTYFANKVRDSSPAFRTEQVTAVVHAPPKSANSTPSLTHRLRRIDSIASSARSTPTHYMSSTKVKVPTKPLSDLTLGSTSRSSSVQRNNSSAFHVVPSVVCKLKSSYSSEGRFSLQSDGETQPSTSDSLLSDASTKTDSSEILTVKNEIFNNSSKAVENEMTLIRKEEDTRPDDDYDSPWNMRPKKRTLPFSCSLDSAQLLEAAKSQDTHPPNKPQQQTVTTEKKRPTLSLALNKQDSFPPDTNGPSKRPNLSLSFDSQNQSRKQSLQLNFGCAALSVVGEKVDATIPLQKQGWYHGSITRVEAENVLRMLKEGSYLVRNSESNKHDFSLSLKSTRGFMHMKIVHSDEKYILGQFSKPFDNIPEMISHYSIYKLPIKGAEHMSLLHPVIDQLL